MSATPQNPAEIELSLRFAKKHLARARKYKHHHTERLANELRIEQLWQSDVSDLELRLAEAQAAWSERSAVAES
jgi:hypothetical protein